MSLQIISQLRQQGITLSLVGGKLTYKAPPGAMTPELRQAISANKWALLEHFKAAPPPDSTMPNSLPTREQVADELFGFYRDLGQQYTKVHWQALCGIPGWRDRLQQVEDAFSDAWNEGGDCQEALVAIKRHWNEGLSQISMSNVRGENDLPA